MGKETGPSENGDIASSEADSDDQEGGRTVYFNVPLPAHEKDDEGAPLAHYARNKIRTAKYTPLSFIPKNLWFQFHNVANMYFLFIIILGVRLPTLFLAIRANSPCLIDLPHLRRLKPGTQCSSSHRNSVCDGHKGCLRGLAQNRFGHRTEQCSYSSIGKLFQRKHRWRHCFCVAEVEESLHQSRRIHVPLVQEQENG